MDEASRARRIRIFGILAGLWMVGLIAAGILFRMYVIATGSEPVPGPPRPSTPLRPPPEPITSPQSDDEPAIRYPNGREGAWGRVRRLTGEGLAGSVPFRACSQPTGNPNVDKHPHGTGHEAGDKKQHGQIALSAISWGNHESIAQKNGSNWSAAGTAARGGQRDGGPVTRNLSS